MIMKKFRAFAEICAYPLGTLGGFGYAAYLGKWAIAGAVVILAIMAYGEFRWALNELSGK